MTDKVFTPLEASRALPLVKRIVEDILPKGRALRGFSAREPLSQAEQDEAHALIEELEQLFAELEALGCSFRCPNFEYGLVDFPGIVNGELVHLCWKDDEPQLRYYHPPRGGFSARRLIPAELLS